MPRTLEEILMEYFGLPQHYSDIEWARAYNRLIGCIYDVGVLTIHTAAANGMITILDKIDTRDGEI